MTTPDFGTMADTLRDLPVLLHNTRRARGLSLRDVRDATGISQGFLSEIERGMKTPGHAHAVTILRWLAAQTPDAGRVHHNHLTRAILERGKCPACDEIHRKSDERLAKNPTYRGATR